MAKAPKAPPEPPDLSQYEDPWCVYATEAQATHAIESLIDVSMGHPKVGTNAETSQPDPTAQQTLTWAEAREISIGGWGFPAPPQQHLPDDPGEVLEYDPAWFPAPGAP